MNERLILLIVIVALIVAVWLIRAFRARVGFVPVELSWEEARSRLLPSIKPQQTLDFLRELAGEQAVSSAVVFECDYRPDLCIMIAIDSDYNILYATTHDVERWQRPKEELLEIAIANLAAKTTDKMWQRLAATAREIGAAPFETGDCYDAARLLLPDFYPRVSQALGCERIAVSIPERDTLLAIPADDPSDLEKLKEMAAERYGHSRYPVTPELIYLPKE